LVAKPKLTNAAKPATFEVEAYNERGEMVPTAVAGEHPLTLYLDKREIVTLMTLGHAPEALAIGYLRNQRLADSIDDIAAVQVDWETGSVAVTTRKKRDLTSRLAKKTVTTGCGQGTVFGDLMEEIDRVHLRKMFFSRMRTSSSSSRECASTRRSTSRPARCTAARSPPPRARS
jgi:FdhD protein